ncbi:MAG TPA: PA14 domain-containing protein, partial [Kiritimatiellia bacterium]|nr:PA14 domain-containing protein [Kiritimatiellia bacterium]
ALTINQAADATFAGSFTGDANATLDKLGAGALHLSHPYSPFAGKVSADAGTLALHAFVTPASVQVPASGALAINTPTMNGLMGYYYSVAPNTNAFWTLAGMESHFAAMVPDLVFPSGASGERFDFGVGSTYTFPVPYHNGGSRALHFEVVWRGVITLPENGTYTFGVQCDDGVLLAIDGRQVLSRNYYSSAWIEETITLDAGRHDIVLGYFQLTGGGGIRLRVRCPSQGTAQLVPSSWLAPYAQASRLSGNGALSLAAPDSMWRTAQAGGFETWRGTLSGVSGSLFAKSATGHFSLSSSGAPNAFAGGLDVQGGILALDAHEQVGDASRLNVCQGATLALAATETVGALSGNGTLAIGGHVYMIPFIGDEDCGISTDSTYTHLLDFPLNTYKPTVNGVLFDNQGSCSGTLPGGAWNDNPNDATRSGIDSLLWDFAYGSTNFTFHLEGLTEGQAYDLRLYFRNFNNNPRRLTFTFSAGARLIGTLNHNPDSVPRSIVGCRYVADASKSITVNIISHETAHTCHLYGLSNEALGGMNAAKLIVAPVVGQNATFGGSVVGLGELTVAGAGTQRFSGASTLATPLTVTAGTAALEPGASVLAGVAVDVGGTLAIPAGDVTLGGLTGTGVVDLQGGGIYPTNTAPYFVTFTNDAGCGISPTKVYTHAIDFGGNGAPTIVNGVSFTRTNAPSGVINGYGWVNAPPSTHGGDRASSVGLGNDNGVFNLLYGMNYSLPSGQTVKLTGLTPGKWYEVRLYNRTWDPACNRTQTLVFDPDGTGPISHSVTYDFDVPDAPPNYLGYRYLAATGELSITITRTVGDSYHLYALTNEESGDGAPGATTLALADDCVFSGTVTGNGGLIKSGAGVFTVTGVGDATGALTVSGGACGVAEGGRITTGPVNVLAGATLFGHGQMGGSVSVASNAWLQAGTAAVCGTLAVGGDLTLAPGANIAWRYADGGAFDTITVAGTVNMPTNGLVQVSSLTPELKPPAKRPLIAATTAINGPDDLSGWTIEGAKNASLRYSDDRTKIYFFTPRGMLFILE